MVILLSGGFRSQGDDNGYLLWIAHYHYLGFLYNKPLHSNFIFSVKKDVETEARVDFFCLTVDFQISDIYHG